MLAPRSLASLAFLGLIVGGFSACSTKDDGKRRIAVIPKGTTHEFWKAIHAGAETAARDLGVRAIWQGPLKEDDRESQIKVVESFVAKGVDGIVIAPLDDKALARPLEDAHKQGIPVIVVDSDVNWKGRASFVATDNYKGGQIAGRELGKLMGGKGKAILMRYVEGSASTTKREQGFLDVMASEFSGIEMVSKNQRAGATVDSAVTTAETLLNKFPDVTGIFCPNESAALGMLLALRSVKKAGKVKFVGFDASSKLLEGLEKGEIDGLVLQDPFAMGDRGVRLMNSHLDRLAAQAHNRKVGKAEKAVPPSIDRRVDTGVHMITKANMNEPAMRRLLEPDLSILDKK